MELDRSEPIKAFAFKNCVLEKQGNKLQLNDVNNMDLYQNYINIDIDKDWTQDPNHPIEQFLNQIMPNDKDLNLLIQTLAHALVPFQTQRWFCYFGAGGNGKSTIVDILTNALQDRNTSALSFDRQLNRFAYKDLVGSMVNISSEISFNRGVGAREVKTLTGGDTIHVEYKGENGTLGYKPYASFYSTHNDLPMFSETSQGIKRRIVIVEFKTDLKGDIVKGMQLTDSKDNQTYLINKLVHYLINNDISTVNNFDYNPLINEVLSNSVDTTVYQFIDGKRNTITTGTGKCDIKGTDLFKEFFYYCRANNEKNQYKRPQDFYKQIDNLTNVDKIVKDNAKYYSIKVVDNEC